MKLIFNQVSAGGQASCFCGPGTTGVTGATGDPLLGGAGCTCANDGTDCGTNAECLLIGSQITCMCTGLHRSVCFALKMCWKMWGPIKMNVPMGF